MNRMLIFTLFLLLIPRSLNAQLKPKSPDEVLFEKAILLQNLLSGQLGFIDAIPKTDSSRLGEFASDVSYEIHSKIASLYSELLDSCPASRLRFRALNNKALAELGMHDTGKAIATLNELISSDADDMEHGGAGSGLMAEPYANYKNRAAKKLASLYIEREAWTEALRLLELTRKYPYRHFCGNEYAADDIFVATMFARCHMGMNEYGKAYGYLLPRILGSGLASNDELVDLTLEALLKSYPKPVLRRKFEEAMRKVRVKKLKQGEFESEERYIVFLHTKIRLDSFRIELAAPGDRPAIIDEILRTARFYQSLKS